jgi:hypothetical protein
MVAGGCGAPGCGAVTTMGAPWRRRDKINISRIYHEAHAVPVFRA